MRIHEITTKPAKPLTSDQLRLKALKDQVKRSQAAVKAERARQKQRAAQQLAAQARKPITLEKVEILSEGSRLSKFIAKIRIPFSAGIVTCTTEIKAESHMQARVILTALFGSKNVLELVASPA